MYTKVGAFDAKAKLSALLREVEQGKRYTITVRGRPIADLVPNETLDTHVDVQAAINEMLKIQKVHDVSEEAILEWISEGRQ